MTLNGLKLFSPASSNNNCFFAIFKELGFDEFKLTKNKCNEIRITYGIEKNQPIDMENAIKIAQDEFNMKIKILTNDLDVLCGEEDAPITFLLMHNHYQLVNSHG